jgi:hypothetical protein
MSFRTARAASAEPIDGFPPLAEILSNIATMLGMILGVAVAAHGALYALGAG